MKKIKPFKNTKEGTSLLEKSLNKKINLETIQCNKKNGLIYSGKIKVDNNEYFFKINSINKVKQEIKNYKLNKKYYNCPKIQKVVKSGNYYLVIYDYIEEEEKQKYFYEIIKQSIEKNKYNILKKFLNNIISQYEKAIYSTLIFNKNKSPNEVFYEDRLKEKGRFHKFYHQSKKVKIKNNLLSFENLKKFYLSSNNSKNVGINDIFDFIQNYKQEKSWKAWLHGDPNESNILAGPIFIDCEATGLNPITSEIAYLSIRYFVQSNYFSPIYHPSLYKKENFPIKNKLKIKKVVINEKISKLEINYSFKLLKANKIMLKQFLEQFGQNLIKILSNESKNNNWKWDFLDEFKWYFLMRLICLYDITKMKQKDFLFTIALAGEIYQAKNVKDILNIILYNES